MAIDADLNSGLIDEREAKNRRLKIQGEADFYGAMDGASKFVKGDAVAGIWITLVNVIGGFIIGVLIQGMPMAEALSLDLLFYQLVMDLFHRYQHYLFQLEQV